MPNPALLFPGTIVPGADLLVMAIPTEQANYDNDGGGEYVEGEPIIFDDDSWYVLEWNFPHNCFIICSMEFEYLISDKKKEKEILFHFCQRIWGDLPECGAPEGAFFQDYQPRLL